MDQVLAHEHFLTRLTPALFIDGGGSRKREALKGEEVQAGRRGDKRGRWA